MNKLLLVAICLVSLSFVKWQPDFETATKIALEKHELILLNFSGSDWCGPCMRLRKEIFESDVFSKMADTTLLMVNADFPRNKKNQLDEQLKKQNEALADKYNSDGKFPFTLLLDATGKVISSWDGMPGETAAQFTEQIKSLCDVNK